MIFEEGRKELEFELENAQLVRVSEQEVKDVILELEKCIPIFAQDPENIILLCCPDLLVEDGLIFVRLFDDDFNWFNQVIKMLYEKGVRSFCNYIFATRHWIYGHRENAAV